MKTILALVAVYFMLITAVPSNAAEEAKMLGMLHCISTDGSQSLVRVYDTMLTKTDRDTAIGTTSETVFEIEKKLIQLKNDNFSFENVKLKMKLHIIRAEGDSVQVLVQDSDKAKKYLECTRLQGTIFQ